MTTGNLVPIERHNRLTAGPAVWTDTRVPIEVFGIACAVYGAGSEDDDKRIYRTIQAVLWKLATQSPAQEESPAAPAPAAYDSRSQPAEVPSIPAGWDIERTPGGEIILRGRDDEFGQIGVLVRREPFEARELPEAALFALCNAMLAAAPQPQQAAPSSGSNAAAPVVTPSDARVEAGAKALAAIWEPSWEEIAEDQKEGYRDEVRAVLKAADAVSAGPGWMPIETAPRDGREFLCTGHVTNDPKRERFYTVVFWDGMFFRDDSGQVDYGTHWMPLPAAPGAEQKGGV